MKRMTKEMDALKKKSISYHKQLAIFRLKEATRLKKAGTKNIREFEGAFHTKIMKENQKEK
jgi:hypothetical protein